MFAVVAVSDDATDIVTTFGIEVGTKLLMTHFKKRMSHLSNLTS